MPFKHGEKPAGNCIVHNPFIGNGSFLLVIECCCVILELLNDKIGIICQKNFFALPS